MLENWIVGLKCSSVRVLEWSVGVLECWRVGGLVFPGLMVGIYIYSACNL